MLKKLLKVLLSGYSPIPLYFSILIPLLGIFTIYPFSSCKNSCDTGSWDVFTYTAPLKKNPGLDLLDPNAPCTQYSLIIIRNVEIL